MTEHEEAILRQLAAGRCTVQAVIDALGPMSLWSQDGFQRELDKARAEEREACAKVADYYSGGMERNYSEIIADAIRARGQA